MKPSAELFPLLLETQAYKEKVDKMGTPLVKGEWMTSLSIGILHPNGVEYYNYGSLNKKEEREPRRDSIYEIGSISKVFTGLLLAEKANSNKLSLTEPLNSWALKDWALPTQNDISISALHLSTHTAGLPRLPVGFVPSNLQNPYAEYSPDKLRASLQNTKLKTVPGEKVLYSNLGVGLLGYALTQYTKKSYSELLSETVTQKIGMVHTFVDVPPENQISAAQGYDMIGVETPDWDMTGLIGMGEINSTTEDLIRFLSVQIEPPKGKLGEAIRMTQEPRSKREGGAIAMGWHIGLQDEVEMIWHNGGTGGARSFAAFDPKKKIGVVVLNTSPSPFTDALGVALFKMLQGKEYTFKVPTLSTVSAEVLNEYKGHYTLSPEIVFQIEPNGNHLHITIAGQPSFPVYPESQTKFNSIHAPLGFEFQRNEEGVVYQLLMHQGENKIPAPKVLLESKATEKENSSDQK
jgi:D-alanyl-D-alanine-carboxypeptidase/D-alanyl-D-alanine-endopeptidase